VLDDRLVAFVLNSLPRPPARVLEVGAGTGELAEHLRRRGYDVTAIDPASRTPQVRAVPLHELDALPESFDGALAVVSLHHVEPLDESCRNLASVVRRGGHLAIDEFDVASLDVTAARWWLAQGPAVDVDDVDPAAVVADRQAHLHPLSTILTALEPWFELSAIERGPYLYRWRLRADLRPVEEREIEGGRLPATGARVVGRRR
jgi:SAM-dependent methyltransferase